MTGQASRQGQVGGSTSRRRPAARPAARPRPGVGARPPRRCAERACSTSTVRHPARRAGLDVGVRVADHPRALEVESPAPRRRRAASRAPACGSRTGARAPDACPRGGGSSSAQSSSSTPLVGQQPPHGLVDRVQRARACAVPLAALGWLETTTEQRAGRPQQAQASHGAGTRAPRPRAVGGLEPLVGRVGHGLVDDAVAVEEHRLRRRRPRRHHGHAAIRRCSPTCRGGAASAGCETSRCQTTAWNASACGVRRSAGARDDDADVGELRGRRRRRGPTMPRPSPRPRAPARRRGRGSSRRRARASRRRPRTRGRRPRRAGASRASQAAYAVSQPSSLMRAVSSETLSLGA